MSSPSDYPRPHALDVVTPSYAPDLDLCADLAASVRRFAPEGTRHTVIVPPADRDAFRRRLGDATAVRTVDEYLPASFRRIPWANAWWDLRSPLIPVRGWIAQQIVKLAAVAQSTARAVVLADSDLEFVRPFDLGAFGVGAHVPLYARRGAVHAGMPRHIAWDAVARRMLAVGPSAGPPLADYICWPCVWDPNTVRAMLELVEAVVGLPWGTAVGRSIHFSEMVLYGVYVDEVERRSVPEVSTMRCPAYSDESALDHEGLRRFLGEMSETDVAVMISARSGTDLAARRRALSELRQL